MATICSPEHRTAHETLRSTLPLVDRGCISEPNRKEGSILRCWVWVSVLIHCQSLASDGFHLQTMVLLIPRLYNALDGVHEIPGLSKLRSIASAISERGIKQYSVATLTPHAALRCAAMWCDALRCAALRERVAAHCAALWDAALCDLLRCDVLWCAALRFTAVRSL